jgi:hypothetical protein
MASAAMELDTDQRQHAPSSCLACHEAVLLPPLEAAALCAACRASPRRALEKDGRALQALPELRDVEDLVRCAAESHPEALLFASPRLQANPELWLAAARREAPLAARALAALPGDDLPRDLLWAADGRLARELAANGAADWPLVLELLAGRAAPADGLALWDLLAELPAGAPLVGALARRLQAVLLPSSHDAPPAAAPAQGDGRRLAVFSLLAAEDFRCAVCFDLPGGRFEQCRNGHLFCHACAQQLGCCPMCRALRTGFSRSLLAERLRDGLLKACPNGCGARAVGAAALASHLEACPRRRLECPACRALLRPEELPAHFEGTHGAEEAAASTPAPASPTSSQQHLVVGVASAAPRPPAFAARRTVCLRLSFGARDVLAGRRNVSWNTACLVPLATTTSGAPARFLWCSGFRAAQGHLEISVRHCDGRRGEPVLACCTAHLARAAGAAAAAGAAHRALVAVAVRETAWHYAADAEPIFSLPLENACRLAEAWDRADLERAAPPAGLTLVIRFDDAYPPA